MTSEILSFESCWMQTCRFARSPIPKIITCVGNAAPSVGCNISLKERKREHYVMCMCSYNVYIVCMYMCMYVCMCMCVQRSSFELYRHYGENNEQAQKLLYELETDESIKAFFIVSWLSF